ncbi:MAG: S41 family peptidase [Prevotella sp.]|jgi:carboxyl-terminal processing protease|nr:S41 family peptidase [Prevotella sp.]
MKRIFLYMTVLLAVSVSGQAQDGNDVTQQNDQSGKNHNLEVAKNLEIFNSLYKHLDIMYVDTLDANKVVGVGIDAMLRSLDPYTEYYPESRQKELKTMLTGKYAGIGALVRYHQKLKRVVIEEPYEGMPAQEVGLKKGDIILQIDDTVMTDKTVSFVSSHLRGEPGTTFVLKIQRPSTGKKMNFKITRRSIKMPEITYYGMLRNGLGYINLNTFTGEPAKAMRRAFLDLKQQGANKLVLDLRGNGGGSLSECVDILNLWIPKGQKIVETRGKLKRAGSEYTTRLEPVDTIMPLVVLVNGETASASEITCGALQDLKRGIIIGSHTYGKGLVQIPNVELPFNANLKLTTSRYYLPSGRGIKMKEGITPDVEIKPDTMANVTVYLDRLDSTEVMFDYVVDYIAKHPTLPAAADFHLSDADYEAFKQRVISAGFTYDQVSKKQFEELVRTAKFEGYYDDATAEFEALRQKLDHHDIAKDLDRHRDEIQQLMEQDIVSAYYYQGGQIQVGLRRDKMLREAERILTTEGEYERLLNREQTANVGK